MSHPADGTEEERAKTLAVINETFAKAVPHNAALGLQVIDFARDAITIRLPFDPLWIGNPLTRVIHGGVVTALIDATCGASVFMAIFNPTPIATLDLRIDYLKPAVPDRAVYCRAQCYKLTKHVAFTRAVAYQESENDPVASAAGAFMLSTKGRSVVEHTMKNRKSNPP